ncbi:putative O-methyltransferase [Ilyonectria destructans]|nr:putative O-methyltransferase [Ilyonectria destructans]
MASFDQTRAYAAQEDVFFNDGREIELLHFVYDHANLEEIRGSPQRVLEAIDEFGRTRKYLMNIGEDKGNIVTDIISDVKPGLMVELGGYVGYSAILFGDALRKAGGQKYWSLERNPEFAAVITSLVELAGLQDIVKVVVGSSDQSLRRLHAQKHLARIDLLFLDHYKPAYLPDLKLCEQLRLVTSGSVLAADNVIKPGNPPYLEYVRSSVEEKEAQAEQATTPNGVTDFPKTQYTEKEGSKETHTAFSGNPCLIYESKLIRSFEPTGIPFIEQCQCCRAVFVLRWKWGLKYITNELILWQAVLSVKRKQSCHADELATASPKIILVTGINMSKGLAVARMFKRSGHRVIGADWHRLSLGKVSSAIDAYYAVPRPYELSDVNLDDPYVERMLEIVLQEDVDLWISVSDVNSALQDAAVKERVEAESKARAIQFSVEWTRTLHNKESFMDHTRNLGLQIPDVGTVKTRKELIQFLEDRGGLERQSGGRQYLIKPCGVDDVARFGMPLLPLESKEATLRRIQQIPFQKTPQTLFLAQEFIEGLEFCTHALVIRGQVRAFVACPSAAILTHYTALPSDSPISQAMEDFTKRQAVAGGESFTGHLSFDFMLKVARPTQHDKMEIYAIECNPRVHTAIVLFDRTPQLVEEYLSALSPSDGSSGSPPLTPESPAQYYWVGQDMVELIHYLYCSTFAGTISVSQVCQSTVMFLKRLLYWKDGTWDSSDILPLWWLYHVYWPLHFIRYLFWGRWSKINVSTGKAFQM